MTQPIDITYVKENPYPDCDELKRMMYTEAGTIIGTTLDNHIGLSLANDFLTSKTSGADVLKTLDYACKAIQCCEACLNSCKLIQLYQKISPAIVFVMIVCQGKNFVIAAFHVTNLYIRNFGLVPDVYASTFNVGNSLSWL